MRALHFRLCFAVLAFAALVAGGLADISALVAAGCASALASEAIGIARARKRRPEPAARLARAACEALPAAGVAAFEPMAMAVAAATVILAAMAAGFETVSVSRGLPLGPVRGETTRRLLTAACTLAVLCVPLLPLFGTSVAVVVGRKQVAVVGVVAAVAALVALRGLMDVALEVRASGKRAAAQIVDS